MEALITFSKVEGIIPAIESAHALSYVEKLAPNMDEKRNYCCDYFRSWR